MPKARFKQKGLLDAWGRKNNRRLKKRICAECGDKFKPIASIQIYCSKKCGWIGNASERKVRIRFFAQVKKTGGCWLWIGSVNANGYGQCRAFQRKRWLTHRLSWFLHRGKIPKGKWILHRCDNRRCVNPKHLFLGSHQKNVDDKVSKNRQSKGEQCRKALTITQVRRILILLKQGLGYGTIAEKFPCTRQNIRDIIKGKIWKHFPR